MNKLRSIVCLLKRWVRRKAVGDEDGQAMVWFVATLPLVVMLIALVILGIVKNLDIETGTMQAWLADNAVLLVIALVYVPIVARLVRGATLSMRLGLPSGSAASARRHTRPRPPSHLTKHSALRTAYPTMAESCGISYLPGTSSNPISFTSMLSRLWISLM